LSRDAHDLERELAAVPEPRLHCDVLIVGSGYGGAVAAARLATTTYRNGARLKVIVVERGREYRPGMFPSRLGDLPGHVRFSGQDGERPRGPDTALWDVRLGDDVNVLLGSGLGGGSLINAAVMERPDPSVWQSGWPSQIDGGLLEPSYQKALHMLQAQQLPQSTVLKKFEALRDLGERLPGKPRAERCHVAVSYEAAETEAGVAQRPCKLCGDCATGCNWQAKNSLDANYLALAYRRGASLYCGVLAHCIERFGTGTDTRWRLRWTPTDHTLGWAGEATPIRTRYLIVCAGSLGSTELLQRSQRSSQTSSEGEAASPQPLRFSATLGSRFSTNGDMIAAAVELPMKTEICADETSPSDGRRIGPTITGMLKAGEGTSRFVVQEFAIPAPLRTLLSEATGSLGMLHRLERWDGSDHSPRHRGTDPLCQGPEEIAHTIVYGLMGDDGARGRLEATRRPRPEDDPIPWDGRIAVQWPEARKEAVLDAQHEAMRAAHGSKAHGWYFPNPIWRPLPALLDKLAGGNGVRGPITTVHPLGGCPMGQTVREGVVDWAGRVFDGRAPGFDGTGVLPGLVVLDGAIVPRALGINPSLTIAALAEHAVEALKTLWELGELTAVLKPIPGQRVWSEPKPKPEQPASGIRILEKVHGTLELAGSRYWGEMQIDFEHIGDLPTWTRKLPRHASFDRVLLRLYPDQLGRDDEPMWRAQRDVRVEPLWELTLSGYADVMFRYRSGWVARVGRVVRGLFADAPGSPRNLRLLELLERLRNPKLGNVPVTFRNVLALASNLGERRGIDYRLHVDTVSGFGCPLQPGDQVWGRKVLEHDPDKNPWRQLSEMDVEWRSQSGPSRGAYRPIGRLVLDVRHFVRQRTTLLALTSQADMTTALADLAAFGLFMLRAVLKMQLLSFIPPAKQPRDSAARRPGPLPGLTIERHDLRTTAQPRIGPLLTRYRSDVDRPTLGPPILLIHGYTASGSTFAHPSIPTNLVQYLCAERRDVWVAELRTSIVFPKTEMRDWTFEDVAGDIPAIVDHVRVKAGRLPIDVVGHCLGAAMFCRAVLNDPQLHRLIRSLTLSQVGPLVQMSAANLLRGYVTSYLAMYIGAKTFDARPRFEPGGAAGLSQTVLDALLASLPYPDGDNERMLLKEAKRQGRPDFRAVRHRSDLMLGRMLRLTDDCPTAPATLDALDDIFGHARVKTLEQVIHYTRLSMLTDNDGRNREITQDALSERMGFPVLMLHGRQSGVFDWRGSLESYDWLRRSYRRPPNAPVPRVERNEEKLHLGLGTTRQLCVFERFGHQDSMIGARASDIVFPVIGEFLRFVDTWASPTPMQADPAAAVPTAPSRPLPWTKDPAPGVVSGNPPSVRPWVARMPWVGPIVGWLRNSKVPGKVKVSFVLNPTPTHARTRYVALVPMRYLNGGWRRDPDRRRRLQLWDDFAHAPITPDIDEDKLAAGSDEEHDAGYEGSAGFAKDIGGPMRTGSLQLDLLPQAVDGAHTALLLLTIHNDVPRRHCVLESDPNRNLVNFPESREQQKRALLSVLSFLADPPANLEDGLLRLPSHTVAARDTKGKSRRPPTRTQSITLALASCQYPNGLLDLDLAQASYRRMAARLDVPTTSGLPPLQLLLLLGDQVYVDETAGLFDPATKNLMFDRIYDRAFRELSAFRAVTSRLPTYMMLDDHEMRDNWQPPSWAGPLTQDDPQRTALGAYEARQASLNPSGHNRGDSYSFDAAPGGWPLCVLDTRTRRASRDPANFAGATIIPDAELDALIAWLIDIENRDPYCPKLIATPGVILPLERGDRNWVSDGWAGYPASRARLLKAIAMYRIPNVVLLAGDVHMSMFSKVDLALDGNPPVTVYSVVSSALYAPWRFANSAPSDFVLKDGFSISGNPPLTGRIETPLVEEANGFAVVHVAKVPGGHALTVELDSSARRQSHSYTLVDVPTAHTSLTTPMAPRSRPPPNPPA
jgi:choline dehydrogenase-like flavoprotein